MAWWCRAASTAVVPTLVDDYVKEEIAVREATDMGLDRDDTVVRRRLRLKKRGSFLRTGCGDGVRLRLCREQGAESRKHLADDIKTETPLI